MRLLKLLSIKGTQKRLCGVEQSYLIQGSSVGLKMNPPKPLQVKLLAALGWAMVGCLAAGVILVMGLLVALIVSI